MKCPTCEAWSEVEDTRQRDGGHRTERRRRCANGHVFHSVEVHRPVYCSAKPRQAAFLATVRRRVYVWRRNLEIVRQLAAGEPGAAVARSWGLSASTVSLVAVAARRAESARDSERGNPNRPEPGPAGRGGAA